ncbi:SGNH/GDSL hydrolase family protein [Gloeocapsa sp. PCC 73106]|uniref:SGNH/GDSL hydrolase family protein n=1 Tax=Gloeocapsa sp. PCC 73106 TaxID=102232 RepID=UPI0002AC6279|nr:SGNH/GDSL hydrolase family protein [Gloeocapsa sp. PCC 73106]ELR98052.1 phospholipase/lecithinase/hemolysin [Gloeocapsa sp. PCC 73106]
MIGNIDQVYFFGDSLTDTGNVFNFTGGFPDSFGGVFPYEDGRFSNGNVWTDYFTEEFNLTVDPFIAGPGLNLDLDDNNDGTNFAIGGVDSGDGSGNVGPVPIGLEQQIDSFEVLVNDLSSQGEVFNNDLYFLWIGANDYLRFIENADDPSTLNVIEVEANFPQNPINLVTNVVVNNISQALQDLVDIGARDIVVFNLPDLDYTPLATGLDEDDQEELRDITEDHNNRLEDQLESLREENPNINLIDIDINQLFDEFIEDPTNFDFTNVTDNFSGVDLYTGAAIPPATGNISNFLWIDSVHPSTKAHELVAELVIDSVADEVGSSILSFGQRPNRLQMEAFIDEELVGRESGSQNGVVPSVDPFTIFAVDSQDSGSNNFVDKTWFDQGEGIGIKDGDDGNSSKQKRIDGDEILGISVEGYYLDSVQLDLFKINSNDGATIRLEAINGNNLVDSKVFTLGSGQIQNPNSLVFNSSGSFDTLHISAADVDTNMFFKKAEFTGYEA